MVIPHHGELLTPVSLAKILLSCAGSITVQVEITESGRLGLKAGKQPAKVYVLPHSLIPNIPMKLGSIHNN